MKTKIFLQFYDIVLFTCAALLCCGFIIYSSQVKEGIIAACERCLDVIIPALFAFTALSSIILKSGIHTVIAKPFIILSEYVFGMPSELFFVFIMGSLAGYPIGIKLLSDMAEQGSIGKKTAECLSVFCYCGGPAFYSGAVGLAVFGSVKIGMLIFISILASNTVIGIIACRIVKPTYLHKKSKFSFSADILTDSVISAGKSMFTICVMIVFCAGIISCAEGAGLFDLLCRLVGNDENLMVLIKSVFEISSVTELKGAPYALLPYVTAVCSFGGICVIMQAAALCGGSFSMKCFLAVRPIAALLSGAICSLISEYFLPTAAEVSFYEKNILVNFNNFVPSICLILMILLLNFKKRLVISKNV